jgi:hypothetical protein
LLTNCADAILAKSGERNGAHGDAPAVGFTSSIGPASSVDVLIAPIIFPAHPGDPLKRLSTPVAGSSGDVGQKRPPRQAPA